MLGDCSTCDYSIAGHCMQGEEGRAFMGSDKPLPCPVWHERGEKWERESEAWAKRNPWPFPTQRKNCSSLCHKDEPCWMTKDGVCAVTPNLEGNRPR